MRPDQVFNQKNGPHTIEVILNGAEILGNLEAEMQIIAAEAVAKAISTTKEQLQKQGVYTNFKQI